MKKIFLLTLLVLLNLTCALQAVSVDLKALYNDLFQRADVLFGLRNKVDLTKWNPKNNLIKLNIPFFEEDIRQIIDYIQALKNANLTTMSEQIENVNKQLIKYLNDLSVSKLSNKYDLMSQYIIDIYKITNIEIPKRIAELNDFKTKIPEEAEAKQLAIDLFKLLHGIGNKIITDFSLSLEEALNQIENIYKTVFKNLDYKKGISLVMSKILNDLFIKLGVLVSFSDEVDLKGLFLKVKTLYLSTVTQINKLAELGQTSLAGNSLILTVQNFKQIFDLKREELKRYNNEINKIKVSNIPASKNAEKVIRELLKNYGYIIKVWEGMLKNFQEFIPELTSENLLKKIDSQVNTTFLSRNINLTKGPLTSSYPQGLTHENLDLWNNVLEDIERFIVASGSEYFSKFVYPKNTVSIWSINKKVVNLIDYISNLLYPENKTTKIKAVESLEDVLKVQEELKKPKIVDPELKKNAILEYDSRVVEIENLITQLDKEISVSTIRVLRTQSKKILKKLIESYNRILLKLKKDIETFS